MAAATAASASAFSDMQSQLHKLTNVFQTSMAAPISTSAEVHYTDTVTHVQTVNDGMCYNFYSFTHSFSLNYTLDLIL